MIPRFGRDRDLVQDLFVVSGGVRASNLLYLATCWAFILVALAVAAHWPSWAVWIAAFVVISSRQQALLNIAHECGHGIFLGHRGYDFAVGSILCAYPCGSPFYSTRLRHLAHHGKLGSDGDPDSALYWGEELRTARGLVRHFALALSGIHVIPALFRRSVESGRSVGSSLAARDRRNLVIAQSTLFALFTIGFGIGAYPFLWLAPLITLTTAARLLRTYCDHALAHGDGEDRGDGLFSIRTNFVERGLVAPYSIQYHGEHHLFPQIPAPWLGEAHRRLCAGRPTFIPLRRGYVSFVVEQWRRLRELAPAGAEGGAAPAGDPPLEAAERANPRP